MKIKIWLCFSGAMLLTSIMVSQTIWREKLRPTSATEIRVEQHNDQHVPINELYPSNIDRDPLVGSNSDPFKVVNFTPAIIVVAPQPPPPPKPSAPTFPYRYFGSMVDIDGKKLIYLQKDGTYYVIFEQQILDGVYRIDAISAAQISITYLPLEEKNIITIRTAEI
jgi:hypothetical protein